MEKRYSQEELRELNRMHLIHNYEPFEPFFESSNGQIVKDIHGKEYFDWLTCYSALNLSHGHPRILKALFEQATKLSILPGCFNSPERTLFAKELAEFCGMEMVSFKNSGMEAVETSLKIIRKWAYTERQPAIDISQAEIVVCANNFHGRSITIVSFSTEPQYKNLFGPHTPGFRCISFEDIPSALRRVINKNTAALLIEPIQGEGGIKEPPRGHLKEAREICRENNILFVADEIQTGFARTGSMFACEYEDVKPDLYILGKSLGGGVLPISAVVGSREIMSALKPGDDGSTFGGNPLACHVGREALRILKDEDLAERSYTRGVYLRRKLVGLGSRHIKRIRGRGLLVGIELADGYNNAHELCTQLVEEGVLCKESRSNIVRLAPPLTITEQEIDLAMERIEKVFKGWKGE